jgi:hypothetical protein
VLDRYLADDRHELGNEFQVVELPWGALVPRLVEGEGLWIVICQCGEKSLLHHVAEVPYGPIDR